MNDTLQAFFKGITDAQKFMSEIQPLEAIWRLDNPTYLVEDGKIKRTVRFTQGHKIKVSSGHIVDCKEIEDATHEIVDCFGRTSDSFSFKLRDLVTNDEIYLYL